MAGSAAPPGFASAPAFGAEAWRLSRWVVGIAFAVAVAVAGLAIGGGFPESWNLGARDWFDSFEGWVLRNRATHPVFVDFLTPIKDGLDALLNAAVAALEWITWLGVVIGTGALAAIAGGWRFALLSSTGMLSLGLLGLWELSVETLALMLVAVGLSLAIGMPLGVWTARNDRVERALRPVLDGMQTIPAFVYLLPLVLLFSIGNPTAVIATVIFAMPPAIRLTSLGLRQVPTTPLEVGRSFGSSPRQLLWKVELPLARPSLMLGVNQTIMMAFGMVVIAAIVGAGGLGREVLNGLQHLDVGQALNGGIAIVVMAIVLDRVSQAWGRPRHSRGGSLRVGGRRLQRPASWVAAGTVSVGAIVIGRLLLEQDVPEGITFSVRDPTNAAVEWMKTHLYDGTSALRDFLIQYWLDPLRDLLLGQPWWLLSAMAALLAWRVAGPRLALVSGAGFVAVGLLGMWDVAMDTLSQVIVAVAVSVALAVPIGVAAARSDRFERALKPLLDTMQTMPAFVYLVPVIALFDPGRVPALAAAVVYALPVGIRLTNLGIRQVPKEAVEAALSLGSTRSQLLLKVQLPLAKPSIMLGINQTVIMVLSVVIIAGLIGAGGLGLEVVFGLTKSDLGRGVEAGLSILLLAIVIDRITQAAAAAPRSRSASTRLFSWPTRPTAGPSPAVQPGRKEET
ncbi:MAG: ABC transporter permease subunit [Thermoleophilia bacterium]|nr:ABC transporter permease subunit [Thermoleophilia bacterium]